MIHEFCRFSLIFPSWLPWLLFVIGASILVLGVWRLFTGTGPLIITIGTWTVNLGNGFPIVLFVSGMLLLGAGAAGVATNYHQPFARSVGALFPKLIDEADPPVSVDFNDKPLGEIETSLSRTGLFVTRMDTAARKVTITGVYKDALCDADLVNQICRSESQRITCDFDPSAKIIRVCAKTSDAVCRNRTL
jgi:hypothetical protein